MARWVRLLPFSRSPDNRLREGHHTKVVDLFKKMMKGDEQGLGAVVPDYVTFSVVASACGKLGNIQNAKEVHGILVERNIPIDNQLEAALISMYSNCGNQKAQ